MFRGMSLFILILSGCTALCSEKNSVPISIPSLRNSLSRPQSKAESGFSDDENSEASSPEVLRGFSSGVSSQEKQQEREHHIKWYEQQLKESEARDQYPNPLHLRALKHLRAEQEVEQQKLLNDDTTLLSVLGHRITDVITLQRKKATGK